MATGLDVWLIPITQWGCVQLVTALAVALTPSQSALRSAAAVIVVALAYSFQCRINEALSDTRAGGPLVAMCWVNVLNAMDLLVWRRIAYEDQIQWEQNTHLPHSTTNRPRTVSNRHLWSFAIAFNYRRINTPWQIAKLPRFDESNPRYVPTRGKFLLVCVMKLCVAVVFLSLFIIDANDPYLPGAIGGLAHRDSVLLPWVYAASTRRAIIQMCFVISFGVVCRATIVAGYNLMAIVAVAGRIYDPVEWPPIASSLTEAYSLRRLWGTAWHQTLRELLTSNADVITSSLLRIPRDSKWARYPRVVIAFVLSGLFHTGMDVAFGISLDDSGALRFFFLQAVGILVENAFQSVFRDHVKKGTLVGG
ncbi:hypothetical protein EYZ11_000351 [Aspergillus tanneri]|uniref:Wax synthase domain-containing protein n=1 Tax=Aspergillus tanneri TaxID=1220188 RepID=A0A4S3JXA4_9EURO|nr:hypothetical protein EYZ11_000351 [Aspergillus tanneri]